MTTDPTTTLSRHRVADSASNRASACADNGARRARDDKAGAATEFRASQHCAAASPERDNDKASVHQPTHRTFSRGHDHHHHSLTEGETTWRG